LTFSAPASFFGFFLVADTKGDLVACLGQEPGQTTSAFPNQEDRNGNEVPSPSGNDEKNQERPLPTLQTGCRSGKKEKFVTNKGLGKDQSMGPQAYSFLVQ
jgi:hypothetical protein